MGEGQTHVIAVKVLGKGLNLYPSQMTLILSKYLPKKQVSGKGVVPPGTRLLPPTHSEAGVTMHEGCVHNGALYLEEKLT